MTRFGTDHIARSNAFAKTFDLESPIMLAPMAGASPVELSVAVSNGGGTGACGALSFEPDEILRWAGDFRTLSGGAFQMNLWIPDAIPDRNQRQEGELRSYLETWGPFVGADVAAIPGPDFSSQCAALLEAAPPIISSIMGVFDPDYVAQMKARSIKWFANVSTVREAQQAEAAGADVIVAKGIEAGGHSAAFNPIDAGRCEAGLMSLLPAISDAVDIPIVATGGIADARTAMAAMVLGASAVQIGTGYLRTPEAGIAPAWANAIGCAAPDETIMTPAYSGRVGRAIANKFALAMDGPDVPAPAPYPIQRRLTQAMRSQASKDDNIDCMSAWTGQSARLARTISATQFTRDLWVELQGT